MMAAYWLNVVKVGNFVIVSNRVASALQAAGPQFSRNNAVVNPDGVMVEIGYINGKIKVFQDTFSSSDYALCGYKGPGIQDAGLIYSPYITGLNVAVAQEDFSKRIGARERYAMTSSLLGSGRYYRYITFSNLDQYIS